MIVSYVLQTNFVGKIVSVLAICSVKTHFLQAGPFLKVTSPLCGNLDYSYATTVMRTWQHESFFFSWIFLCYQLVLKQNKSLFLLLLLLLFNLNGEHL